jgi:hypothetical protein
MTTEKIYPKAPAGPAGEDVLDRAAVAATIIDLREKGCPADYKCIGISAGQPLPEAHIRAIALAGKNAPLAAKRIYDEIEEERLALRATTPEPFDTQTAYLAELTAKARDIDPAKWLAGVKVEAGVSTWPELKEVYPTPVKVVEEPVVLEK